MVVLDRHAFIFEGTGRTCNVRPFSDDLGIASNIPIVDGAIAYDCPYSKQTFILIVRNVLYIKTLDHNLIPPFIMRAGGVTVNDVPKIHCDDPTRDDHCILFQDIELRIPLQLIGTFSYFHSRMPTATELYDCDKVFLTPDASDWNPHCLSFERNERSMLNYEGNIVSDDRQLNHQMEIDDEARNIFDTSSVTVEMLDSHIDASISSAFSTDDYVVTQNEHVNDVDGFAETLSLRREISKFAANIGSCTISDERCSLFTDIDSIHESIIGLTDPAFMRDLQMNISSLQAGQPVGIDSKTLSKLWLVSESLAKGAIDQNTQLCRHNADNTLSRQFTTNDRMLRYRRIQSVFFTDTMFASPKAKSTRGNTCCQVFVSDKGFVAVYPMKSQTEFETALHWFCKQVGVPVSLILDAH